MDEKRTDSKADSELIQPVSEMTVMHDMVQRVRRADGTPAPRIFEEAGKFDIVLWMPILYVSWTFGSFGICCLLLTLVETQEESNCHDRMKGWIITLTTLVSITAFLALWATVWICKEACQRNRVSSLDTFRIVLYRF